MSGYSYDPSGDGGGEANNPVYSDGNGFEGLGDDASGTPTSSGDSWWSTLVTNLAPAIGKEASNLVGKSGAPAATVNVGVAPQTQTMLMYGALGIGALFLVSMILKKKR